jgi:pyrroline-5-carboxylate reductase
MYKFGFIGFGSMANMLINSLIKYADVSTSDIAVTRKDKNNLHEFNDIFKGINTFSTASDVVINSKQIFICTKPAEIKIVLEEIRHLVRDDNHIIFLAGTVSLCNIEKVLSAKITKLIPTITSQVGEGISLMCHNKNVTNTDISLLESYISKFSKVKIVNDNEIGFAAELTSCMPGLIAGIFDNLSLAAINHTDSFSQSEINDLLKSTLYATSKLMHESKISFEQIITRVATKGGITIEGVSIFNEELPSVFNKMFIKTLKKREMIECKIDANFN